MGPRAMLSILFMLAMHAAARNVIVFRRTAEVALLEDAASDDTVLRNPAEVASHSDGSPVDFACSSCLQVSRKVENFLADPSFVEKADAISRNICNLVPSDLQEKCLEKSAVLVNEVVVFLKDYFSEETLCNSTGLCVHSPSPLKLNAIVADQLASDKSCATCRDAVAQLQNELDNPDRQIKLISALLKACENVEVHAKECKELVFKYAPLVLANLDKYLKDTDICAVVHVCKSADTEASPSRVSFPVVRQYKYKNLLPVELPVSRHFERLSGKRTAGVVM